MSRRTQAYTIAGTIRSDVGFPAGVDILESGGSALDAVEASIRLVEDNLDDWTVGTGGLPNLLGDVELDASIMDGRSLRAGAVAGIRHYREPISIARRVMEETPHVLLVGQGADAFAEAAGFKASKLLTPEAEALHRDFVQGHGIVRHEHDSDEAMTRKERYFESFSRLVKDHDLMEWYRRYAASNHGTVNVICRDTMGDLCSGVSTSGLSFKFPGRSGDSPIIGAGNYADNRYGAAAVVGIGELAIRLSTARMTVSDMAHGSSAQEAAVNAVAALRHLPDLDGGFAVLSMSADGEAGSACSWEGFSFWVADSEEPSPRSVPCEFVDVSSVDQGLGYHR